MHKIKPSEIYVILKYGNKMEAERMYQSADMTKEDKKCLTTYILRENDQQLFDLAEQLGMLHMTVPTCNMAAGIGLNVLQKCIATTVHRHGSIASCVTEEAACYATKMGHIDVLQYLIDNDCPINWSASMEAIRYDRLEIFKWLELNVPGRVYHSYELRWKQSTFEIPLYLHSKGYEPTYLAYQLAVKCGDYEYAKWLQSINCPNSLNPDDLFGDQLTDKFRIAVNKKDFQTIITMLDNDRIPDTILTKNDPFIKIVPKMCVYIIKNQLSHKNLFLYLSKNAHDLIEYLFFQISRKVSNTHKSTHKKTKHHKVKKSKPYWYCVMTGGRHQMRPKLKIITKATETHTDTQIDVDTQPTETVKIAEIETMLIDFLKYSCPTRLQMASIYVDLCTSTSYEQVFKYVTEMVHWKSVFLMELNKWISAIGIYQPTDLINYGDELWNKYSDKIDELRDESNLEEWNKLKNGQPWTDQLHAFIGSIMDW